MSGFADTKRLLVFTLTTLTVLLVAAHCLADTLSSQSPINYETADADDPVARLQKLIDDGSKTLEFDARHGYLPGVLKALVIPSSSQSLVFSKTSFQRDRIAPWRPRALYFNSDVYVGWVQGGELLEIASIDKQLGPIFYTLVQGQTAKPRFHRQTDSCLQCHETTMTQEVPGLVMRSVIPDADGLPIFSAGNYRTTDASPLARRWGGWYVTGLHGAQRHMGNLILHKSDDPDHPDLEAGANLAKVPSTADTSVYLAPGSDVVALMVLAHQTQIHNLIVKASYETRIALRDEEAINEALGEKKGHTRKSTTHRIESACEPLVRGLLFSGEWPLSDKIEGSSTFAKDFTAVGPRDRAGRSLREFDMTRRMFKYPCSYLIYTESFAALPARAKQYIYDRLWDILGNQQTSGPFAHLSAADRRAVREILTDTLGGLPDYWKQ